MKINTTLSVTLMLALTLFSCKGKQETEITDTVKKTYPNMEKAAWLLGEWGDTSPEGKLVENWVKLNDSVYHGESYFIIEENDTVFAEAVVLDDINGKMAYTVTVPNQNNGEAVRFDMKSITDTEMVFENPQHNFPSKISYKLAAQDSLVAVISGTKDNETFSMKRIR